MLSTAGVRLYYALESLLRVVKKNSNRQFAINRHSDDEMRRSNTLLKQNRNSGYLLRGVSGVMDEGRMPCVAF